MYLSLTLLYIPCSLMVLHWFSFNVCLYTYTPAHVHFACLFMFSPPMVLYLQFIFLTLIVNSLFFILCSWRNYPWFYCTYDDYKSWFGPAFLACSHWISCLALEPAQCLCCDALSPPGPTCRFWSAPTHPWPPRPPCCRGVDRSTSSVTVPRRYNTFSSQTLPEHFE